MSRLRNGLLQLQSLPPGWGLTFSSYPLRLAKIAFTPEDFRKIWVYPWRIGSYPWRIWVYPWRIVWKLRLHPQRIPYFFYSTPKEILNFYNLPLENSMVPQPADIKYNSPVVLLGVRAWADPRFVSFSGFNFLNFRRASLSISQEKNRTSLRPGY